MKKSILKFTIPVLLCACVIYSCKKKEDEVDPSAGVPKYSVDADVDGTTYMIPTNDLASGSITVVGKGSEIPGDGGWNVNKDGYYYIINYSEGTLDQYKTTSTGYQKIASLSNSVLVASSYPRQPEITSEGDLLMCGSTGPGVMTYSIINIPEFTLKKKGTVTFPIYKDQFVTSSSYHGTVIDGKVYVGTAYSNRDILNGQEPGTIFPDSLMIAVYNYPSYTFDKMLYYPGTSGETGKYRQSCSIVDEQGDLYWINNTWFKDINAKTVFFRIRNGEVDNSYDFNLSSQVSEGTHAVFTSGFTYAGNGIAYAPVCNDGTLSFADVNAQNCYYIVKIDLYNKTVTKLNIPNCNVRNVVNPLVENGKIYWPINILGGTSNIYEITVGGGANDFTVGAKLDGSDVFITALYKN